MGSLSRCGPCVDEVAVTMRCHEADAVRMRSLSRCGSSHDEVAITMRLLAVTNRTLPQIGCSHKSLLITNPLYSQPTVGVILNLLWLP
eukprot:scaffold67589_cov29-Attheya_sp.AAC.1